MTYLPSTHVLHRTLRLSLPDSTVDIFLRYFHCFYLENVSSFKLTSFFLKVKPNDSD